VNVNHGALQLILIMDYILDWARDMYRNAIIRSLHTLKGTRSGTLTYRDSDIVSTMERVQVWAVANREEAELPEI
jgi:hypothetical protein